MGGQLPMSDKNLLPIRITALAKRELRNNATWALACGFLLYALWGIWRDGQGLGSGQEHGPVQLGLLSFSSWISVLVLILLLLLPLWIIERVPHDQKTRWLEPLFVRGWRRGEYLLSVFFVIVGIGVSCFLASVLVAWLFSLMGGGAMPADTLAIVAAGVPTLLAWAAGGLFLATLFRDRTLAIAAGVLGILVPLGISAILLINHDITLPDPARILLTIHVPPAIPDPSLRWLLYKLTYASVAVWLSLVLVEHRIGRRP